MSDDASTCSNTRRAGRIGRRIQGTRLLMAERADIAARAMARRKRPGKTARLLRELRLLASNLASLEDALADMHGRPGGAPKRRRGPTLTAPSGRGR